MKKRIASCVGIEESVAGACCSNRYFASGMGGTRVVRDKKLCLFFFIEVCHNIYRVDIFKIRKIELLALASYSGIVQDHDITIS